METMIVDCRKVLPETIFSESEIYGGDDIDVAVLSLHAERRKKLYTSNIKIRNY